jgi:hypothetical protein
VIVVTLSYPNGQRREVLLAGVPREGEHIRLSNGADTPSLVVDQVLWMEREGDQPEPIVLILVHPHRDGPRV